MRVTKIARLRAEGNTSKFCKYKKILWLSELFDYKSAWYI
jgi:hypothetical protein